jgi:uncharacterized protein (DUF433 family)
MSDRTRHKLLPHDRKNPAEQPAYYLSEAAYYLRLPATTVRDWSLGHTYSGRPGRPRYRPLIEPADPKNRLLSFVNLVELHVIASIRWVHLLKAKPVRKAIDYLRERFGSRHPFIDQRMLTDGSYLFIEQFGQLVNVSQGGQTHLRDTLDAYLKRIEWDESHIPIRLFPFTRLAIENVPQLVAINPRVRSGQPCITGTGIPTRIISQRHAAGDSVALLAADYGRTAEEIEEAIRYERRTAA